MNVDSAVGGWRGWSGYGVRDAGSQHPTHFFFFTLVTRPRRSLRLELSDTRGYAPQIQARTLPDLMTTLTLRLPRQLWSPLSSASDRVRDRVRVVRRALR